MLPLLYYSLWAKQLVAYCNNIVLLQDEELVIFLDCQGARTMPILLNTLWINKLTLIQRIICIRARATFIFHNKLKTWWQSEQRWTFRMRPVLQRSIHYDWIEINKKEVSEHMACWWYNETSKFLCKLATKILKGRQWRPGRWWRHGRRWRHRRRWR